MHSIHPVATYHHPMAHLPVKGQELLGWYPHWGSEASRAMILKIFTALRRRGNTHTNQNLVLDKLPIGNIVIR